jgi:Copper type II ascorbate-dependent monooxygenase, C-terminal domain
VCTASLISSGITIISNYFHAHLRGRWLASTLIRDGKEVGDIGRQRHYDFKFQNTVNIPGDGIKVLPGTCGYDTTAETGTVVGGLDTNQEMCFNFVEYYPAIESLAYCSSNKLADSLEWQSDCSGTSVNTLFDPSAIPYTSLPKRAETCSSSTRTSFTLVLLAAVALCNIWI